MTLEQFFAWLVAAGLPGLILVVTQAILKRLGFDPAVMTPRLAALLVAALVGISAGILQFGLGLALFPEIKTPLELIQAVLAWLAAGQAIYNLAWKPAARALMMPPYRIIE
jgi:hypothetical protein